MNLGPPVEIRVPFFFCFVYSRGTLPSPKKVGEKGHLAGGASQWRTVHSLKNKSGSVL